MRGTAAEYFGSIAPRYDSLIRRAVPRYDELIERLVGYLPKEAGHVLELGCGTGNLSLLLARRYPEARLTLVDASADMLAHARARLERFAPGGAHRIHTLETRFEDLDLEAVRSAEGRGCACDAVTACMSLHHVAELTPLFGRIHRALAPDGVFAYGEMLRAASPEAEAVHEELWVRHCRQPGGLSSDELAGLQEHAAVHDHYLSVRDHAEALAAAGFEGADCLWRNLRWTVMRAVRPAAPITSADTVRADP